MKKLNARQGGFTLIELMVTVAVAALLMGLAVPSLWSIIQDNRLTAQSNDFLSDIRLARSEAIKRSRRVTMCRCKSDTAGTGKCKENNRGKFTCFKNADYNWDQGWIVFVDADEDTQHDGPDTEEVIRVHDRLPLELDLSGSGAVGKYVSFDHRGMALKRNGKPLSGTLTLENPDNPSGSNRIFKRVISVSSSGLVESCNPNDATCPSS
jgi:type IV fimbrial biogenesis protein FimT